MVGNDNATQDIQSLKNEIDRLSNELEEARQSAYAALREREILLRSGRRPIQKNHSSDLQEVPRRVPAASGRENIDPQMGLDAARSKWEEEFQKKLASAKEEWADEERKRIAKVKVDMSLKRRAAVEERDAYWQAEIERLGVGDRAEPDPIFAYAMEPPRRAVRPTVQSDEGVPYPGVLTGLVVSLVVVLAAYIFAPQWQPVAKTGLDRVMAQLQEDTRFGANRSDPDL